VSTAMVFFTISDLFEARSLPIPVSKHMVKKFLLSERIDIFGFLSLPHAVYKKYGNDIAKYIDDFSINFAKCKVFKKCKSFNIYHIN
jgi:hypothetical protein